MADRGVRQAVKLDEELDGNSEEGGNKQDAYLATGEANPVEQVGSPGTELEFAL